MEFYYEVNDHGAWDNLKITVSSTIGFDLLDMNDNSIDVTITSLPIMRQAEFSSVSIASTELNDKMMTSYVEQEENNAESEVNNSLSVQEQCSLLSKFDYTKLQSMQTIISDIVDDLLTQIDSNINIRSNVCEPHDSKFADKKDDSKTTKRSLRSRQHDILKTLKHDRTLTDHRRASNRKRSLEKPWSFAFHEKLHDKKPTTERSNDSIVEQGQDRTTVNGDTAINGNDGSHLNKIIINLKQIQATYSDLESLPPNKRRLRERNVAIMNQTDTSTASSSSSVEENVSIEPTTRTMPRNCIKKFLEIRQQIEKRRETMLHDFVQPKIPKDFAETLMAKKNYLINPSQKSFSIATPASLGIQRLSPPSDLDSHLSDTFNRLEDERYRMKLRHQVERDKLILSHEQEVLRLYGNATRLSIHQDVPLSYCSLLRDSEVYNNPTNQERPSAFANSDFGTNTELGKRGKNRWNGRFFIKSLEDSNFKYKRLSCEINQRQSLESNTLYSMQRMAWLKQLSKEASTASRISTLLSERYLPKVEINSNFWTEWETNQI